MKIAVITPTRGKPFLLTAGIEAFRHLSSGENEIKYFVRVDQDENVLYWDMINNAQDDVNFLINPAPLTPTLKALEIVESQPFFDFDPDVHVLMSDDVLPLTFCWDMIISANVNRGLDAFCWEEAGDQHGTGYIILSKKYVQAMPSYFTTWFPFWFNDTWRAEVYRMVFGRTMPIDHSLKLGGKRGKTYGMQDLEFWFDFFAKTRKDRIREAELLADNLGVPFKKNDQMISEFEAWDKAQKQRCMAYEQRFGGNPSPQYVKAKQRAEEYLKNIS